MTCLAPASFTHTHGPPSQVRNRHASWHWRDTSATCFAIVSFPFSFPFFCPSPLPFYLRLQHGQLPFDGQFDRDVKPQEVALPALVVADVIEDVGAKADLVPRLLGRLD